VAQVRGLSLQQAAGGVPVRLHVTLTYYEPSDGLTFVQDQTGGVFVYALPNPPALRAGDRVTVVGVTTGDGFTANIRPSAILFEHTGTFPHAVPATWRDLMRSTYDSNYVSLTGKVRAATVQLTTVQRDPAAAESVWDKGDWINGHRRYILMDLQTDGGIVRVHMEHAAKIDPLALLDSQVTVEGVTGGIFDGKYQQIGAELWMSGAEHMRVLGAAPGNPTALPLTRISRIMTGYYGSDNSQRVHVRGTVTLYQPGLQMTLQTPDGEAVLVNSYEQSPIQIGQVVDVVGFPDPHGYSEVLTEASIFPTPDRQAIQPVAASWNDTHLGRYPYELVSLEGKLAAEVHEPHQDTLVLQSGSHVFSAILSRTVWNREVDAITLPDYHVGSTVRVTGICFVHAGGPWNTERWFDVELRSSQDIVELAPPSWWTVRHLLYLSAALLGLMMTALLWAMMLQRKVRRQTEQIRLAMAQEAARERQTAYLETERARVLEAINSMQKLEDVLEMILRLVRSQLGDGTCWCELASGIRVGEPVPSETSMMLVRRDIHSGAGERLGSLVVAAGKDCTPHQTEVLEMGGRLAALAIDNRRLYETLIHHSQYDQLTNAANRFLLESRLDEVLSHAQHTGAKFALIYIDLDDFKQVNDRYGHRAGDLYLQQVAERFSERLRGMDTLARVGGDEFIALIPVVRSRTEAGEIVDRLSKCFDAPFVIEDRRLKGSASIGIAVYPEDGATKEELKRVADAAMYANKPSVVH
jgi:diguanylate cyclase (GGDEF)-like protein